MTADRLLVVAGPTATGKSDLGLELAEQLGGEVINADSMQLYRGMDIGTAKVPPAQRRGVRHHLLDVLDVTVTASVAAYQSQARSLIRDLLARDVTPVLVGGSGLYIRSVIDEIDFPATDPVVRRRLEDELAVSGLPALRGRLQEQDPAAAKVIDPADGRRTVRALEVIELTGRPFSATLPVFGRPRYDAVTICLDRPVAELDQRIERRVSAMVEAGLLDEVRHLDTLGLRAGVTASRALGYRQFLSVIDGGSDIASAASETAQATRRFVRRQRSWFGRDKRFIQIQAGKEAVGEVLRLAAKPEQGTR